MLKLLFGKSLASTILFKNGSTLKCRGFYPKGGGEVNFGCSPVEKIPPITLLDRGKVTRVFGISYVAGTLPVKVWKTFCRKRFICFITIDEPMTGFRPSRWRTPWSPWPRTSSGQSSRISRSPSKLRRTAIALEMAVEYCKLHFNVLN